MVEELDVRLPRQNSLPGLKSSENKCMQLTGISNQEQILLLPQPTESHLKKINEIVELALNDPTYKIKLKYIQLPEKKTEDQASNIEDETVMNMSSKKVPMAI